MTARDLDEVAGIARSGFEHAWTRDAFADELARDVAHCRVVRTEPGGPIRAYAVWWLVAGEQSLLTVSTAPDARRQGLARALLREMLDEGRAHGADACFLEVRPSNAPAIALYRSLGFEPFDVRPRYYDDGEDAWILRAPVADPR
ncbi:ribosomal protein S18-alanine N-acetyltransferase [Sandaracinus amylolyticus]|uniref:ribosomal protein S18-alanine N-acetyltransferase n=1 Tax=Sandaracinus amylolyticus TaxID=927083 RepID=UPI001F02CDEE|nr:ribosomal protein S18-alanine N-acetyltransferase [Sandaracinus amylolyticus]UJR81970.1 Ribosomal-protein-alanine N-acetyltransferase RimI [Sandaracinus amylolyticus]